MLFVTPFISIVGKKKKNTPADNYLLTLPKKFYFYFNNFNLILILTNALLNFYEISESVIGEKILFGVSLTTTSSGSFVDNALQH